MKDDHVSWREWKNRFPGGLTWREFLGYIRDDSDMKFRLAVLVTMLSLGVASIAAAVAGRSALTLAFLASMVGVGLIGYGSTRSG